MSNGSKSLDCRLWKPKAVSSQAVNGEGNVTSGRRKNTVSGYKAYWCTYYAYRQGPPNPNGKAAAALHVQLTSRLNRARTHMCALPGHARTGNMSSIHRHHVHTTQEKGAGEWRVKEIRSSVPEEMAAAASEKGPR